MIVRGDEYLYVSVVGSSECVCVVSVTLVEPRARQWVLPLRADRSRRVERIGLGYKLIEGYLLTWCNHPGNTATRDEGRPQLVRQIL